jgi:hypothetical protein
MPDNIPSSGAMQILSGEKERLLSLYRETLASYYEQHPELENHTRLGDIGTRTDTTCQDIYADVLLDCIRRWIRVKDFKIKSTYEIVKADIGISKSSFYNILKGQRKYSLKTKLKLIDPFVRNNRIDLRLCEDRFQEGTARMTRIWREAIRESEMYVDSWIAGQRIERGEPGRLISNTDYYIQARAMVNNGTAGSYRDAARQIAEQTREKPETVRKKMQRGKHESGDNS